MAQHHGIEGVPAGQLIHGVPHEAFINASFAYAKSGELNRFNGPDRGAWYAALDVETCLAEVTFHMTGFLERIGDYNAVVDYAELHASLAGEYLDLRAARDHPCLNPDPAIGYKLVGIQSSWHPRERWVEVVPIRHWLDGVKSRLN